MSQITKLYNFNRSNKLYNKLARKGRCFGYRESKGRDKPDRVVRRAELSMLGSGQWVFCQPLCRLEICIYGKSVNWGLFVEAAPCKGSAALVIWATRIKLRARRVQIFYSSSRRHITVTYTHPKLALTKVKIVFLLLR